MMAVDSKQGGTTVPATGTPHAGTPTPSPAATLAGMPAVTANGKGKRKRPSSLLAAATSLPSVENSLDEFIARANETLVDTNAFNADKVLKEEDEKRKEADALRWKATEQQMLQSQAREESLRRQLDGLQGKLAEAEARAAVASAGGSQDGIIADLKVRLTASDERARLTEEKLRGAEERASKLAQELVATKAAAASVPAALSAPEAMSFSDTDELEQRVRVAEAKSAKAIAVAKAAAAGLSINPADIAAIESGLVVPMETGKKGSSWGLAFAALLVGGAVAFAAAFVMFNKKDEAPKAAASATPAVEQAQPQAAAPTPAPAPAAPAKPIVTPIEEPAPAAAQPEAAAAAPEAKAEAPAEKAAPAAETKTEAVAEKKAPAKKATAAKKTTKAKASGAGLADPFGGGDTAAPAKKATKPAKKSGGGDSGIVDPF